MMKYKIIDAEDGNVITYDLKRYELLNTLAVWKKFYDGDDWDAGFYEVVAYDIDESIIARWDGDGNMIDILDDYLELPNFVVKYRPTIEGRARAAIYSELKYIMKEGVIPGNWFAACKEMTDRIMDSGDVWVENGHYEIPYYLCRDKRAHVVTWKV